MKVCRKRDGAGAGLGKKQAVGILRRKEIVQNEARRGERHTTDFL